MKTRLLSILFISLLVISCDYNEPNEGKFDSIDPESGWVEFGTSSSTGSLTPNSTEVNIPIVLNAPVNDGDLVVNYEVNTVTGDEVNTFVTNSESSFVTIPSGELSTTLNLMIDNDALNNLSQQSTFQVVLVSTDRDGVSIGLSDDSQITTYSYTFPCDIEPEFDRAAQSAALGAPIPAHEVELTPLGNFQYQVEDLWGPELVATLTGDPSFSGQYPYPAILTVDEDTYEVTVTSADPSATYVTGGSGTYDSCSDVFNVTISQGLFSDNFTVDVVLTVAD